MKFQLIRKNGQETLSLLPEHVYVVGYSGSNREKTMAHIRELEEQLNVAPPKQIPTIFEVSKELLTQDQHLYFLGEKTSGECEYVILIKDNHLYIGLGSDHTDRELEALSVPKAKQVCLKPIAREIWDYEDIKDHFSELKLTSQQNNRTYQRGTLADIMSVENILKELNERIGEVNNCIIFSGTVPLVDSYVYSDGFVMELVDERLNRKLTCQYEVNIIPDEAR